MIPRRNRVCNKKIMEWLFSYIFLRKKRGYNYVGLFEEKLARFLGAKYTLLTPTGRKGLSLIIDYYSFPKGAEIILPAYTLKDLVFMIKEKGYVPVFVDINPQSYNIDASLIEAGITEKTVMIIATHIFGMPCQMDKIVEVSKKHKLIVVEDCAHALGARYKGKAVGTFADVAFFSFEVSKPINTFGGGAVATDDEGLKDYIRNKIEKYAQPKKELLIKVFTSIVEDFVIHSFVFSVFAYLFYFKFTKAIITRLYLLFSQKVNIKDFTYTHFQAFLGLMQLEELKSRNKMLMNKIFQMRKYFKESISYQKNLYGAEEAFYYNIIQTDISCEELRKRLLCKGIDVGIKDEITDNCVMQFRPEAISLYPVVEERYNRLIQLPLSGNMNERLLKKIADTLNSCLE